MIAPCENTLSPVYLDSQKGNGSRYVTKVCSIPYKTSIPNGKKEVLQPPQYKMKVNAWEIKPPDFSYKLYKSLRFPEKSSRTSKEEQGRGKKCNFPETMLHLPNIRNHSKKVKSPPFITTFPHLDSHKAKLMFVKSGKYPNGVYLNPKPHDFRQYQRSLPNFVTACERDPFGLKFKSKHLSTVHGHHSPKDDKQKNSTERFITYKPHECTWDSKLILLKAPWPMKSASYTRHRRRRDVYSAFMDRVEEKFTQTCKNRLQSQRK
ncbi:putative uncharacterized protein C7orf78 homolog isoform X1 [Vulpes vulpes]|uniref:Uncharacterized protein n=3 Tax=Vulpes vulpes TaxID=9627 RepID=A0ABM5B0F9_VULVU